MTLIKKLLALILSVMSIHVGAQIKGASGHLIYCADGGITNFRPDALNNFLFSTGEKYENMITYGGSVVETIGANAHSTFDATTGFHLYRPQKLLSSYDSSYYMMRGWELMTSIYGYDVLKNANAVDLVIAPGVYWGSLKLRKYFNSGNPKQYELFKNPFVAPMIRADLRFVLGPVCIGGRVSWRYDITNGRWRKGSSVSLPGYKARETQYVVFLGWVLNRK